MAFDIIKVLKNPLGKWLVIVIVIFLLLIIGYSVFTRRHVNLFGLDLNGSSKETAASKGDSSKPGVQINQKNFTFKDSSSQNFNFK